MSKERCSSKWIPSILNVEISDVLSIRSMFDIKLGSWVPFMSLLLNTNPKSCILRLLLNIIILVFEVFIDNSFALSHIPIFWSSVFMNGPNVLISSPQAKLVVLSTNKILYSIFRELLSRMITRCLSYQRENIFLICTDANKKDIVPERDHCRWPTVIYCITDDLPSCLTKHTAICWGWPFRANFANLRVIPSFIP